MEHQHKCARGSSLPILLREAQSLACILLTGQGGHSCRLDETKDIRGNVANAASSFIWFSCCHRTRRWLKTTLGLPRSWKQGASLHAYFSKWSWFPFVFCNLASGLVSQICIRGDLFGISPGRAWWKHVKESLP